MIDIYQELISFDMDVDVYDPWASREEVKHEYGIDIFAGDNMPVLEDYSAIVLAVSHKEFLALDLKRSAKQVVYDVKAILPKDVVDARL